MEASQDREARTCGCEVVGLTIIAGHKAKTPFLRNDSNYIPKTFGASNFGCTITSWKTWRVPFVRSESFEILQGSQRHP